MVFSILGYELLSWYVFAFYGRRRCVLVGILQNIAIDYLRRGVAMNGKIIKDYLYCQDYLVCLVMKDTFSRNQLVCTKEEETKELVEATLITNSIHI